jgi:predicted ATP-dependent endonuclease of OLD family
MVALRYFLLTPSRLTLRDVTIANWTKIDLLGEAWESGKNSVINFDTLLPCLDVWLNVPLKEIQYVAHLLPTLEWNGGLLGVRLKYEVSSIDQLKKEYLLHREAAKKAGQPVGDCAPIKIWPECLTNFLERKLRSYIELTAYPLDPAAHVAPKKGLATPQALPASAFPLEKNPFRHLIKIDEIAAQRDFADAGGRAFDDEAGEASPHRFKRRLSDQLRSYYDRHLDPAKTPSAEDYEALGAMQTAELNFDKRLRQGFSAAFEELELLGYPGVNNPKLKITTQLRAIDGLKHGSAVQYELADPTGDGLNSLRLPEDYVGLGYQNLIAMVFMLMSYRDDWMRVGKAVSGEDPATLPMIPRLHLVLVEEPEAHLHVQIQQVFINKAYTLLRKHPNLGETEQYCTQLVVSTHSSHVAHEADFASLRYFRRRPADGKGETPTTTVANLSYVFGDGDDTQRFVKRYLKATHCDLFFADGIIFVEGQAERILVPHFIRHHFPILSRRYVTLLDLGGSHAHSFKQLVDELGLCTLIVADLDATHEVPITTKAGVKSTRWKAVKPQLGVGQKTSNPVLKDWHPKKEWIDELAALADEEHQSATCEGYELRVAYQKPLPPTNGGEDQPSVIPRTFEDALVLQNIEALAGVEGSPTSAKIVELIQEGLTEQDLADELFALLKSAEKAAFALDCLMHKDAKAIKPPRYIQEGLAWFEKVIEKDIVLSEPAA